MIEISPTKGGEGDAAQALWWYEKFDLMLLLPFIFLFMESPSSTILARERGLRPLQSQARVLLGYLLGSHASLLADLLLLFFPSLLGWLMESKKRETVK